MRLLLAEDDLAIQDFLKRALINAGYHVDIASNAQAGELRALSGAAHTTY
jgi:DNA-binding response OmpR family regulator